MPTKSARANVSVRIFERDRVLGRHNIEIEPWDGPLFSEQGLKWAQYSRVSGEQIIWQSVTRVEIFWLVFSTKLVHRNKLEPLGTRVEPWLALSLLRFVCLFVREAAIQQFIPNNVLCFRMEPSKPLKGTCASSPTTLSLYINSHFDITISLKWHHTTAHCQL